MSEFFIGQIMMAGFNFAPKFWALANGQLLPINQNQALFSLLGTQYGGNGTTNFALPDLRGRTPVGYGQVVGVSLPLGTSAGAAAPPFMPGVRLHGEWAFDGGYTDNAPIPGQTLHENPPPWSC